MIESRSETDFLLLDVRQPEEYEVGHLPGARLVSVEDVEQSPSDVPLVAHNVLYCHTGVRSKRAADVLVSKMAHKGIYVLDGGLNAWRGRTLEDFPNVRVFDGAGTLPDVILRALDLEKGAHRLYDMLSAHFASSRLAPVLTELLRAEVAHGKLLHRALERSSEAKVEPFDKMFEQLTGDVIENGAYLDEMLLIASEVEQDDEAALLELALGVEYMAYDLYRSLSYRVQDDEQRKLFVALAEQEKSHVRFVLKALGKLAKTGESRS